jgi:hypothetical protein
MVFWYPSGSLRLRIGQLIETYCNLYAELKDLETGQYVIIKISELEFIR